MPPRTRATPAKIARDLKKEGRDIRNRVRRKGSGWLRGMQSAHRPNNSLSKWSR